MRVGKTPNGKKKHIVRVYVWKLKNYNIRRSCMRRLNNTAGEFF